MNKRPALTRLVYIVFLTIVGVTFISVLANARPVLGAKVKTSRLDISEAPYAAIAATVSVTNTNDSGAGSLRQAIASANVGDIINFSVTTPATITLTSGELVITQSLQISGPSANLLTIQSNGASRIFTVTTGVSVTLADLTMAGGNAGTGDGGGLFNAGVLTITNAIVSGNTAANGGGIFNQGLLLLNASRVRSNIAITNAGGLGNANGGVAILVNSLLSGNTAAGQGGGLRVFSNSRATIFNNVSIINNTAPLGSGLLSRSIITQTGPLTISGELRQSSQFFGGNAPLTILGDLVNEASGVFTTTSNTLSVSGYFTSVGQFRANGGVVNLTGCNQTVFGNTTFNTLTKTSNAACTLTFAAGSTQTILGALTLQGAAGNLLALRSTSPSTRWNIDPQGARTIGFVDVQDSNNINATAITAGTGSTDSGNNVNWNFAPQTCPPTYTVTTTADIGAGSLRDSLTQVCPGGLIDFSVTTPATITLTSGELVITQSLQISGPGANLLTIQSNGASRVITVAVGTVVNMAGLTIANGNAGVGDGGGLFNAGVLTITNAIVSGNTAANGGGIFNQGLLLLNASRVRSNIAITNAGGLGNANGGVAFLVNSLLSNNTAAGQGGGLRVFSNSRATIFNNVSIINNTAPLGSGLLSRSIITQTGPLTISGELRQSSQFFGGNAPLVINNNLINESGGVFTATSNVLSLGGDFINAGQFLANGGTFALTGCDQTLAGNFTFQNLSKVSSAACTLTFAASSMQTILGALTLQGAVGNLLTLRSTAPSTRWLIDPQGARTISFVDVQDSNNVNATVITAGTGSIDSGNNVNWSFPPQSCFPTYTVITTTDTGAGSLRDALTQVCLNGLINFSVTTPATITLGNTGELVFTQNLTLQGPGANLLTIQSNGISRVMTVAAGIGVNMFGLTIANGNAGVSDGGGLFNAGSLTATNIIVSGNTAANGGGIFNQGTLFLFSSGVRNNIAITNAGGLGNANGGVAFLSNSTLSGNSATGQGGGLRVFGNSRATIFNNVSVLSNTAALGSGLLSRSIITQTGPLTLSGELRQSSQFFGGNAPLTILGDLVNEATGVFTAPSNTLSVSGYFTNVGQFRANGGAVNLTGCNQTVFGNTTFNTLTKVGSAACTLTFAAGSTQTILGALTLQGAAGNLLALRSTNPATRWNLDPQGARTISLVDVQDSNNIHATAIAPGIGSVDSGNNVNWDFSPDVSISKTVSPATAQPGDVVTYAIAFSNIGSFAATGVVITDLIPVSVTVQNIISSGVAITDTGATASYVWNVQNLASGVSGYITLTGVLSNPLPLGVVTNTALITASGDNNPSNNVSAVGLNVSPIFTLTINTVGNGSVGTVPSGTTFSYGTVVTLTATPASSYWFVGWSGDLLSVTNPITITMDANKVITATFDTSWLYLPLLMH